MRSHGKRDSYYSFGILRKCYDLKLIRCEAAIKGLSRVSGVSGAALSLARGEDKRAAWAELVKVA